MELEGTIANGTVVFDQPTTLPEGTRVMVTVEEADTPTLFEMFKDIIGKGVDLPEDYALNHGHYVRGEPKK